MPRFLRTLFGQVLLALGAGVLIGFFWPDTGIQLKPLGDGFIKLIKMIIPLLVFCVVVHGIAGAGDLKRVGRVGVKSLIYFELVTTVALGLGLLLAFVFQPGAGMNVDPRQLDAAAMSALAPTRPTFFMSFMPAMPVTTVQNTISEITILISLMKPSPSGFMSTATSGQSSPMSTPIAMPISTCTYRMR